MDLTLHLRAQRDPLILRLLCRVFYDLSEQTLEYCSSLPRQYVEVRAPVLQTPNARAISSIPAPPLSSKVQVTLETLILGFRVF